MVHTSYLPALLFGTTAMVSAVPFRSTPPDFGPDFVPSNEPNMNGDYVFSTTPGGTPGLMPKQFRDYPGGVEYYDVYSGPMKTLYSQVWWSPLAPASFPTEMVEKYAGKAVAIVGWEIDQVRRTPQGDVSVPISATYNHHYVAHMTGAGAKFNKVVLDGPDDPLAKKLMKMSGHGMIALDQPHYVVEEVRNASIKGASTNTVVSSANGGEYRKSYHGFAPGHAIVIESPEQMQITPMQIDTWNRDEMDISGPLPPKFVAGPLPAASQAPEGAMYSGLLECPMTTRLTKVVDGAYTVQGDQSTCSDPILTFQECYHAAAVTLGNGGQTFVNSTGSDPTKPRGCSVTTDPASPSTIYVYFNKLITSSVTCAAGVSQVAGSVSSLVDVSIDVDANKDAVTISLTGPQSVWYGVGFGAQAMADQPWTLIVDGTGAISERQLGGTAPNNHVAGTLLSPSVKVVNNTVNAGLRTVVVSRTLKGAGPEYFSFNVTSANPKINFIAAIGTGPTLAYHKDKVPSSFTLLPLSDAGACVCPQQPAAFGQATGQLVYHKVSNQSADIGTGAVGFGKQKCKPYPTTVLNEQENPTCDIRHYTGGQWACHHMWSLLDAEQEIPWSNQTLEFYHKWRVWVQPYNETYHQPLHYGFGTELVIGSPYEYDVPKCAENVPGCELVNGTWIHTITGNIVGNYHFAAMNFHCHAPTCLSMAVYACDKGTPLDQCNTTNGKLICMQRPVYGGTDAIALNGTRFDEPGYIAIPDCFWGKAENGLEPPPDLTGIPLHMVKTANATWGHYGEMAGGQPFCF